MPQNLTNADAVLKEVYEPVVREQLNNRVMLLAQLDKNTEDFEGRRAVLSLHVSRSGGYGARAESAVLPTAGNQGYAEERVPIKTNYATISISGRVIRASQSDVGSFTRVLDAELRGVQNDSMRDLNRQCYNDAEGTIAQCGTTTAATLVVLAATTTTVQMRQFHVNQIVDIGTLASPATIASARTITAVDVTNKTITISGAAVTTSSSHYVTVAGTKSAAGATNELTGLRAIVASSGTLFNVNPATYDVWKSYVDSNSGTLRSFTDNLLEKAVDEVEILSDAVPNFVVASYGARRALAASLKSQKRFVDNTELKGGFSGIRIDVGNTQLTVVAERDCPANTAFLLNLDALWEYVQTDWRWDDTDGSILSRNTDGTDSFTAFALKDHEIATDARNKHGRIDDLQEA